MLKPKFISAALTIAAVCMAGSSVSAREKPLSGEEQLAKMLAGRVAGKPVSCISLFRSHDSTVIDKTAIVYRDGRTIYVNRPRFPETLRSDDIMVIKVTGSELCNLDIVQMRDRSSLMQTGFVGLEQFTPYTTAPKAAPAG